MYMVSATIATTDQKQCVIPQAAQAQNINSKYKAIIPQNNGKNNIYLGDMFVSPTNALTLNPGGSLNPGDIPEGDLKEFWIYGTAGDTLNIMVFP